MRLLPLLLMLALVTLGVPVGFALGLAGLVGIWMMASLDTALSIFSTSPYRTVANFTLTTVPLYILMAEVVVACGLAKPLFTAVYKWTSRIPGGVAIATVLSSAGFGACSGSSTATSAAMAGVAYPEMKRLGYDDALSAGSIAVGGTIAIMIPPSIAMVVYGSATETSIGALFLAGILPGILTAVLLSIAIMMWASVTSQAERRSFALGDRLRSLLPIWPILILAILITGSLYGGLATPTELGAIGALVALLLGVVMGRLKFSDLIQACEKTLRTTSMIFVILIGAVVFGYYLVLSRVTQDLSGYVLSLEVGPYVILLFVALLYIALGMILDNIAILILTLPLTFPVVVGLGFDPVWFGVFCTFLGEIGLVTPPVGLNAFVTSAVGKIPLESVFRGCGILLSVLLVSAFLIVLFPEIATWIPEHARSRL